jgi:hypothetical protein
MRVLTSAYIINKRKQVRYRSGTYTFQYMQRVLTFCVIFSMSQMSGLSLTKMNVFHKRAGHWQILLFKITVFGWLNPQICQGVRHSARPRRLNVILCLPNARIWRYVTDSVWKSYLRIESSKDHISLWNWMTQLRSQGCIIYQTWLVGSDRLRPVSLSSSPAYVTWILQSRHVLVMLVSYHSVRVVMTSHAYGIIHPATDGILFWHVWPTLYHMSKYCEKIV